MKNNKRIVELKKQIDANNERTRQLSAELPKLNGALALKLEAQKTAIIEGGSPTDLEAEIVNLRLRIEGVNNAIASLVMDTPKLVQEKANIE
jgi:hypothetical protein